LKVIFFKHGCLIPTIFSNFSETQRPSGCVSESVLKIVGTTVFSKMTFNAYVEFTLSLRVFFTPGRKGRYEE